MEQFNSVCYFKVLKFIKYIWFPCFTVNNEKINVHLPNFKMVPYYANLIFFWVTLE